MTIKVGESPEGGLVNKFIAQSGDGQRGMLLAIHKDGKHAVMLALNGSIAGDVKWGRLYLVVEYNPNAWPRVIEQIDCIPEKDFVLVDWTTPEVLPEQ